MKTLIAALALSLFVAGPSTAEEAKAKGQEVKYEIHTGHFQKNDAGLKGDASYLVFTDRDAFDKVFGQVPPLGGMEKPFDYVPKGAFEKDLVVAVIKRGKTTTEYKVDKVTQDDGTLYVQYTAKPKGKEGSAMFASPLIISVPKDKYRSVVFLENGKEVEKVKVEK